MRGPYVDNMGVDMIEGGGKLFAGSSGRFVGPGHFGLVEMGQGVQKFSLHYEADLDRGGSSVLDIRPLLWRDGWPVAGDNFRAGDYVIESSRTGTVLELAGQGVQVGGARPRAGGSGGEAAATRIPTQEAAQVSASWPTGPVGTRLAPQMLQAQQLWRIAPAPQSGGYPGSPYFRISIVGTERTLSATAEGELSVLPTYTGAPAQLWRIDQLDDGSYRLMPKALAGWASSPALSAAGSSTATLSAFRENSDRHRWIIKTP